MDLAQLLAKVIDLVPEAPTERHEALARLLPKTITDDAGVLRFAKQPIEDSQRRFCSAGSLIVRIAVLSGVSAKSLQSYRNGKPADPRCLLGVEHALRLVLARINEKEWKVISGGREIERDELISNAISQHPRRGRSRAPAGEASAQGAKSRRQGTRPVDPDEAERTTGGFGDDFGVLPGAQGAGNPRAGHIDERARVFMWDPRGTVKDATSDNERAAGTAAMPEHNSPMSTWTWNSDPRSLRTPDQPSPFGFTEREVDAQVDAHELRNPYRKLSTPPCASGAQMAELNRLHAAFHNVLSHIDMSEHVRGIGTCEEIGWIPSSGRDYWGEIRKAEFEARTSLENSEQMLADYCSKWCVPSSAEEAELRERAKTLRSMLERRP